MEVYFYNYKVKFWIQNYVLFALYDIATTLSCEYRKTGVSRLDDVPCTNLIVNLIYMYWNNCVLLIL